MCEKFSSTISNCENGSMFACQEFSSHGLHGHGRDVRVNPSEVDQKIVYQILSILIKCNKFSLGSCAVQ
jgi:hypothetical protein